MTIERPKPMVPVVNKPVLAHILSLLKSHNFSEVIITVQYLADLIEDYFGDGSGQGLYLAWAENAADQRNQGLPKKVRCEKSYDDRCQIGKDQDAPFYIDVNASDRGEQILIWLD